MASNEPVSDDVLESVASTFQTFVSPTDDGSLSNLPFSRRMPILIGTIDRPIAESADSLFQADAWAETRLFPMPDVYGEDRRTSLGELLWIDAWDDAELQPGGRYSYEPDRQAGETYFAGLSSIVVAPENPNSPWDRTFLFVESTPDGPEVIAMVIEVHQP